MLQLIKSVICFDIKRDTKKPWSEEIKSYSTKLNDMQDSFLEVEYEVMLLVECDIAGELFTGKIKCLKNGNLLLSRTEERLEKSSAAAYCVNDLMQL